MSEIHILKFTERKVRLMHNKPQHVKCMSPGGGARSNHVNGKRSTIHYWCICILNRCIIFQYLFNGCKTLQKVFLAQSILCVLIHICSCTKHIPRFPTDTVQEADATLTIADQSTRLLIIIEGVSTTPHWACARLRYTSWIKSSIIKWARVDRLKFISSENQEIR